MPKQVLSFEILRKAGLRYLERYAASTNAFKLVLRRKVMRMEVDLEQRSVEVDKWIGEALVETCWSVKLSRTLLRGTRREIKKSDRRFLL